MNNVLRIIVSAGLLAAFCCMLPWVSFAGDRLALQPGVDGVWDIEGRDELGNDWIGTLALTVSAQQGLAGHIDWVGRNGHCGREYVRAGFKHDTRQVEFSGLRTKFTNQIAKGAYKAVLSGDGNHLHNGQWGSGLDDAVPGTWQARRINLHHD